MVTCSKRCSRLALFLTLAGAMIVVRANPSEPEFHAVELTTYEHLVVLKGHVKAYDAPASLLTIGEYQVYLADALAGLEASFVAGEEVVVVGTMLESTGWLWATGIYADTLAVEPSSSSRSVGSRAQATRSEIVSTDLSKSTEPDALHVTGIGASTQSITGTGIQALSRERLSITGTGK